MTPPTKFRGESSAEFLERLDRETQEELEAEDEWDSSETYGQNEGDAGL